MHLVNLIVALLALLRFTDPVAGTKLPKCQCFSHGKKMAPGDRWRQREVSGWWIMTCDKSGCPKIEHSCANYLYDRLCLADPSPCCTSPAEACKGCQEAYDYCAKDYWAECPKDSDCDKVCKRKVCSMEGGRCKTVCNSGLCGL